ncbi:pirin family protein [Modestobacter sp. Leaf380]|uniref:pirin family protein n=1 Tax=Modestobacter sp. Leaf380 TaxID=1736356 RepID=UPI0006F8D355|nr:pirin family protein [Modestobacter sp. Leaf380]KQS66265.1 hypothetical protein ASG41_13170 [Modestobacter sp. Leaf380]
MTDGLESRVLLAPLDGSTGPLLRIADDRLDPGAGYGTHAHADVDVVAVLVSGSLAHNWGGRVTLRPGDVAVLRAGSGLTHDEVAGADGAHVLQTYLRAAVVGEPPRHGVVRWAADRTRGWVDLDRPDARLWVARLRAGEAVEPPEGLRVVASRTAVTSGDRGTVTGPATVLVWQLDAARPAWAQD